MKSKIPTWNLDKFEGPKSENQGPEVSILMEDLIWNLISQKNRAIRVWGVKFRILIKKYKKWEMWKLRVT